MYPEIYKAMAGNNRMTIIQLSSKTGITVKSLSNKLNGKTEFKLSEMRAIQSVLGGRMDELFSQNKEAS